MKSVYLNWTSTVHEFFVTDQDYWNVLRPLVMKLRVCATCEQYCDPDATPPRPCVGLRICLQCLLKKHPELRFLEVKSVNDEGEATYAFLDADGQVYTSRENYSPEPSRDISYSLLKQGFALPERYTPARATEEIVLHASHFTIYGDLQTASVLVANYADYHSKLSFTFLLYKQGGYKELTKRGVGKVLLERAEALLQQTRLPDGYYLVEGRKQAKIWESDIYKVISQMESAMYTLSLAYTLPATQEQPEMPETDAPDSTAETLEETQVAEDHPRRSRRLHLVPSQESSAAPIGTEAAHFKRDPTPGGRSAEQEVPTE